MRQALRVLMVIPGREEDKGVMVFARREAAALEREGVAVRIYYLTTRTAPLALTRAYRELTALAESWRPDLVHAQFGTVTGLLCTFLRCVPVIVCFRGSDLNPYFRDWRRNVRLHLLRHSVARALSQVAAMRANGIVCVSEQLRHRLYTRRRGIALINPASIPTQQFVPLPRDEARAHLGWEREDRVVLFAANRTPAIKRPDLARAAVEYAARAIPRVRLQVLDGRVPPELIPLHLNASDALILTSDYEGSPTIVAEALSCNLPVVSVDVGDVRERLNGVHPSFVVERKPEALGEALVSILGAPTRSNGRAVLEHELDDRAQAARLISYYRAVMGGHPHAIRSA